MGMSGQLHVPTVLPPGERVAGILGSIELKLGGFRSRFGPLLTQNRILNLVIQP
jgi:hypothetical protein